MTAAASAEHFVILCLCERSAPPGSPAPCPFYTRVSMMVSEPQNSLPS